MANQIFVDLPVKDLKQSMECFDKLGFTFNKQCTDDNAACMVIGENIFSMRSPTSTSAFHALATIADAHKSTDILAAVTARAARRWTRWCLRRGRDNLQATADGGFMYAHGSTWTTCLGAILDGPQCC
jgi:predicted lactoylglutathione lyase